MKDLDFDELDKAVSSLMASAPKNAPNTSDENEKVITLPDSTVDAPKEKAPAPDPIAVEIPNSSTHKAETTQEKPRTALVAPKRSGRFMDVVHPSSDMRQTSNPVSRTRTNILPLNDNPSPGTSSSNNQAVDVSEPVKHSEGQIADGTTSNQWPDPIDLSTTQVDDDTKTDNPEQPSVINATTSVAESLKPAVDKDVKAPTQLPESLTPFLPDAKVEKRPLGGASTDKQPTDIAESTDQPIEAVVMPAELSQDVLAIESGNTGEATRQDANMQRESKDTGPTMQGVTTSPAPTPNGPVSIAQQYKEQSSSVDDTHAAIYDTHVDSHALAHPAKKKSGWLIVVAIILLIALGAGGAAYLYFTGVI